MLRPKLLYIKMSSNPTATVRLVDSRFQRIGIYSSLTEFLTASFSEQTTTEKVLTILWVFVRICIVILSLYLFVCSLSFLSAAFQILGGKSAGKVRPCFKKKDLVRYYCNIDTENLISSNFFCSMESHTHTIVESSSKIVICK